MQQFRPIPYLLSGCVRVGVDGEMNLLCRLNVVRYGSYPRTEYRHSIMERSRGTICRKDTIPRPQGNGITVGGEHVLGVSAFKFVAFFQCSTRARLRVRRC